MRTAGLKPAGLAGPFRSPRTHFAKERDRGSPLTTVVAADVAAIASINASRAEKTLSTIEFRPLWTAIYWTILDPIISLWTEVLLHAILD